MTTARHASSVTTTADFATASGGTTGVKCAASSFTATVVDNPVAPGIASESTTDQTFGSCTANIFGVTAVNSVVVNHVPFATTVESPNIWERSHCDGAGRVVRC